MFLKEGLGIFSSPKGILAITHPTVGLITGCIALSSIINKTKILVSYDAIKVHTLPIPWPFRNRNIRRTRISQLYVLSYVPYRQNGRPIERFKVMAQVAGKDIDLIKGVASYEKAVTLELEIEKIMGIKDTK